MTIVIASRMAIGHVMVKAPTDAVTKFLSGACVILGGKINAPMVEELGPIFIVPENLEY